MSKFIENPKLLAIATPRKDYVGPYNVNYAIILDEYPKESTHIGTLIQHEECGTWYYKPMTNPNGDSVVVHTRFILSQICNFLYFASVEHPEYQTIPTPA